MDHITRSTNELEPNVLERSDEIQTIDKTIWLLVVWIEGITSVHGN